MNKEGYQPIKTKKTTKIIPPNTGSNVQMKKDGYTWEDLEKAWWEGFDTCKAKVGEENVKLNDELEKLKKQLEMSNKVYNDNLDYSHHIEEQLTKAKEIIKEFMKYEINEYDGSLEIHFEELKKQADQFISEVEK